MKEATEPYIRVTIRFRDPYEASVAHDVQSWSYDEEGARVLELIYPDGSMICYPLETILQWVTMRLPLPDLEDMQ